MSLPDSLETCLCCYCWVACPQQSMTASLITTKGCRISSRISKHMRSVLQHSPRLTSRALPLAILPILGCRVHISRLSTTGVLSCSTAWEGVHNRSIRAKQTICFFLHLNFLCAKNRYCDTPNTPPSCHIGFAGCRIHISRPPTTDGVSFRHLCLQSMHTAWPWEGCCTPSRTCRT